MLYRLPRVLLAVFTRSGRAYGGRLLPATTRAQAKASIVKIANVK